MQLPFHQSSSPLLFLFLLSNLSQKMAQNFDPFHVPQQNRRNKLRVNNTFQNQNQNLIMMNNNNNNNNTCDPLQQGLSLSLSFQLLDDDHDQIRSYNNGNLISSVPLGPFTGYASILKNSRFLKPAQQVLDDLCGAGGSVNCDDFSDFSTDFLTETDVIMRGSFGFGDRVKLQFNDSKLMFLLDEVYKKYKVYCEQMQSVVASFETVAGLGNAAPYICYAIKTVSKHFTCLKNALLNHIHQFPAGAAAAANHHEQLVKCHDENQISFLQHPVWRSQRGLPDHAVAVLKSWLFEHFLHPYPTDSEKQILAQHTGLSRTQVSNWFINARVRLWKPMVEEVYKLSSQQPLENTNNNNNINPTSDDHNSYHCIKTKRSRHELNINPSDEHQHMSGQIRQEDQETNLASNLENLTSHYQGAISGRNNGVNLALELHQNNNYGPINNNYVNNMHLFGLMDPASAASFQAQAHNLGN